MIVGEAPGEQEDLQGEPFVGKAGQLLDNMLRAIGLTRERRRRRSSQVFIANTLKCRPPRNRNPEPDELAQCEPFLRARSRWCSRASSWRWAASRCSRCSRSDEPIGRLRGRVHRYEGVPLVVTYHPAYLLRNLADKARAWDDLCLALEIAGRARSARNAESMRGAATAMAQRPVRRYHRGSPSAQAPTASPPRWPQATHH